MPIQQVMTVVYAMQQWVFSNGIIIQWNNTRISEETQTLPIAYSNTNYYLGIGGAVNVNDVYRYYIATKTTTTFRMNSVNRTATSETGWITFGIQ